MTPGPTTPALTPWRATFLMVGAGVGAGIMAVPILAERVGLAWLAIVLIVAYAAAAFIHLMLVEIVLRTGEPLQIVELMRRWVLGGRIGGWLLWLVFALLTLAFVAALAAYVAAESEIVSEATGLPPAVAHLVVYLISAGVVFFGLRVVGIFETDRLAGARRLRRGARAGRHRGALRSAGRRRRPSRPTCSPCSAWSCTATTRSSPCRRSSRAWRPMAGRQLERWPLDWSSTACSSRSSPSSRWASPMRSPRSPSSASRNALATGPAASARSSSLPRC